MRELFHWELFNYCLASLLLEVELLHDARIASRMILLEIDEMRLAVSDHAEEPAARVIVFLVLLEVIGELGDLFAQKGHLDFRRSGILVVDGGFFDDFGLLTRR